MVAKATQEPDTSKQYVCYFCEEVVYFGPRSGEGPHASADDITWKMNMWRHVATELALCGTTATPSNLEFSQ